MRIHVNLGLLDEEFDHLEVSLRGSKVKRGTEIIVCRGENAEVSAELRARGMVLVGMGEPPCLGEAPEAMSSLTSLMLP
jgi:hypothetical protein